MSTITWPALRSPGVPASGRRRAHTAARAAPRAARTAAIAASGSAASAANTRETVGSEATGPNTAGCARTAATSDRQSPPSAIAVATSRNTLPGSCTPRSRRHGDSAEDKPRSRPATRAASRSSNAPEDDTSDSRPESRTNDGTWLDFTYGVPSAWHILDLRKPKFPKQDRHFRTFQPRVEPQSGNPEASLGVAPTASSCWTCPWVNERRNVPSVEGARTPANNRPIPPWRSRSRSSIESAPASIPPTTPATTTRRSTSTTTTNSSASSQTTHLQVPDSKRGDPVRSGRRMDLGIRRAAEVARFHVARVDLSELRTSARAVGLAGKACRRAVGDQSGVAVHECALRAQADSR